MDWYLVHGGHWLPSDCTIETGNMHWLFSGPNVIGKAFTTNHRPRNITDHSEIVISVRFVDYKTHRSTTLMTLASHGMHCGKGGSHGERTIVTFYKVMCPRGGKYDINDISFSY